MNGHLEQKCTGANLISCTIKRVTDPSFSTKNKIKTNKIVQLNKFINREYTDLNLYICGI